MKKIPLIVHQLGLRHWESVSLAMHQFTDHRNVNTPDELWLVEHYPVFTKGQSSKDKHLLIGDIPVFQSDRGGKITYHGPGQQVMYVLIDLKRRKLGIRQLITAIEQAVVNTLACYNIDACSLLEAPGVYVAKKKICSLGLRIRNGCSFHGLSLNISMDLTPFQRINPCGYTELEMTQISAFCPGITLEDVQPVLIKKFLHQLSIFSNLLKIRREP